jgi:hypothetical protein
MQGRDMMLDKANRDAIVCASSLGQYNLDKYPGLSFRGVIGLLSDAEESVIGERLMNDPPLKWWSECIRAWPPLS